jgi:antitoxin HicB
MNVQYPAIFKLDKEDKRYTVQFIDLEEAITEGETLEEAYFNATEVLTLTLDARMDEKMPIPKPSKSLKAKGAKLIAPSARTQTALLMRWSKGDHTFAEIARVLNTSWPAVSRLENPHYWASLKQLERVAAAMGKKLVISFETNQK